MITEQDIKNATYSPSRANYDAAPSGLAIVGYVEKGGVQVRFYLDSVTGEILKDEIVGRD